MPRPRVNCHVYVDFDGTIMPRDTTDFLLERFALPAWHDVEAEWAAGRIGSRECMARQVELLRATPEALRGAIDELTIDPTFVDFVAVCADRGIGTTIVSDGLDLVIASVLARHRLDVRYFANRLTHTGGDRWRLDFPHAHAACAVGAGHCKCARSEAYHDQLMVVVGDGRSDFCIAGRADLVLAKAKLLEECGRVGLPHLPFDDFEDVTRQLNSWLDGQGSLGQASAGDNADRRSARAFAPGE